MKRLAILFCVGFLFSACVKNNPKPIWLKINEWDLVENPDITASDPGDLTHNLSDAQIFVDEKLIGTFELPCRIPVLASGSKSVRIYPTIRNNGISATKKVYPFCQQYELTMDLVEGETYTINPTTYYKKSCLFWVEDFSGSTLKLTQDSETSALMAAEHDPAIALTGFYGHVHLNEANPIWEATLSNSLILPKGGAEVYLEVDYRNDQGILSGIFALFSGANPTQNDHITMNGQTGAPVWKKIYLDYKEIVSYSVNATSFLPYFRSALGSGQTSGDIYIDNIRIVHY